MKTDMRKNATFNSNGDAIKGHLYLPNYADHQEGHPAVVVGGPIATVEEQSAGVFANQSAPPKGFRKDDHPAGCRVSIISQPGDGGCGSGMKVRAQTAVGRLKLTTVI